MKKIISGKVYDTEKAKELGMYANYGNWRDFNHIEETLYRKKTGEFFLFGEGGPNTKYAERVESNSWTGGSRIMPMSYDEAKAWAEEHLTADEYEEIFGEIVEDDGSGKQVVSISVSPARWELAKREAAKRGIGISEYIESLIKGEG